jgi:hypothetical protein
MDCGVNDSDADFHIDLYRNMPACHGQQAICSLIWLARYAYVEDCSARLQLYVEVVRAVVGK